MTTMAAKQQKDIHNASKKAVELGSHGDPTVEEIRAMLEEYERVFKTKTGGIHLPNPVEDEGGETACSMVRGEHFWDVTMNPRDTDAISAVYIKRSSGSMCSYCTYLWREGYV